MYQQSRLSEFFDLVHGFSERADGNMSFRWGERDEVRKNRRAFLGVLGVPLERCVGMEIRHGTDIAILDSSYAGRGMRSPDDTVKADACITHEKNLFPFLLTADCLPVIIYDPKRRVFGLVHISRMNSTRGMAKMTVEAMQRGYGCDPRNLIAVVGPSIRKESCVFAAEEFAKRIRNGSEWKDFLLEVRPEEFEIDIAGYNVEQLLDAGVQQQNLEVSDVDTAANELFFSHRRTRRTGEAEGRMATVVGLN